MNQPIFGTTATALREKSKLRRHFRRFDMFFYRICTVVTIDTIGAVARGAVLTFFVVSVAVYAARHGVHGFGGHAFLPSYAVFIAVVPVLFFNYAGGKTRRETAAEPVVPAYVPADSPGRAS